MIFDIFKKKKEVIVNEKDELLVKTAALLINVAKIDEEYTEKEKDIIKKVILELGAAENNVNQFLDLAEKDEENSNQILEYTKEIKQTTLDYKTKLIEALWKIIFSNDVEDMYESSLMRRLSGLLYLDKKLVGDIKEKVKKDLKK